MIAGQQGLQPAPSSSSSCSHDPGLAGAFLPSPSTPAVFLALSLSGKGPKKIKQVRGQDDRVEGADARLEGGKEALGWYLLVFCVPSLWPQCREAPGARVRPHHVNKH